MTITTPTFWTPSCQHGSPNQRHLFIEEFSGWHKVLPRGCSIGLLLQHALYPSSLHLQTQRGLRRSNFIISAFELSECERTAVLFYLPVRSNGRNVCIAGRLLVPTTVCMLFFSDGSPLLFSQQPDHGYVHKSPTVSFVLISVQLNKYVVPFYIGGILFTLCSCFCFVSVFLNAYKLYSWFPSNFDKGPFKYPMIVVSDLLQCWRLELSQLRSTDDMLLRAHDLRQLIQPPSP